MKRQYGSFFKNFIIFFLLIVLSQFLFLFTKNYFFYNEEKHIKDYEKIEYILRKKLIDYKNNAEEILSIYLKESKIPKILILNKNIDNIVIYDKDYDIKYNYKELKNRKFIFLEEHSQIQVSGFYEVNNKQFFNLFSSLENHKIMLIISLKEMISDISIDNDSFFLTDKKGKTYGAYKFFNASSFKKKSNQDNIYKFNNGYYLKKKVSGIDWYIYIKKKIPFDFFKNYDLCFLLFEAIIISMVLSFYLCFYIIRPHFNIFKRMINIIGDRGYKDNFNNKNLNKYVDSIKSRFNSLDREISSSRNQLMAFSQQLSLYSKELGFANEKLKELETLKGNFISGISHELRTPLVTIIGYNELILKEKLGEITPEQNKGLLIVQKNLKRLNFLIENMLDYARFIKNEFDFEPEIIDFYEVVSEVLNIILPNIEDKKININNLIPEKKYYVLADKEKAMQMLMNFVLNSVKFTQENGFIEIGIRKIEKNHVYFFVRDNGIGIEKNKLDNIFDHFFQVDQGFTKQYHGIGLGLAIAKAISDLHGGDVFVESSQGVGTTVIFSFKMKNA